MPEKWAVQYIASTVNSDSVSQVRTALPFISEAANALVTADFACFLPEFDFLLLRLPL